ncbi:uncharacterized protein N7506_002823 [Penicillium brevicompactum]|uniref:uncharacterized protein n=1 Tax=Penicillium brevicompactum TaxID=5074 RepID=UPI00253F7A21|nr:uncharacterized protein N7506_002823 [Penicillium brevicompactum]KAJ5342999.1 hypothetical protein N7506_002823 [Penicillium brevicompactum]
MLESKVFLKHLDLKELRFFGFFRDQVSLVPDPLKGNVVPFTQDVDRLSGNGKTIIWGFFCVGRCIAYPLDHNEDIRSLSKFSDERHDFCPKGSIAEMFHQSDLVKALFDTFDVFFLIFESGNLVVKEF